MDDGKGEGAKCEHSAGPGGMDGEVVRVSLFDSTTSPEGFLTAAAPGCPR